MPIKPIENKELDPQIPIPNIRKQGIQEVKPVAEVSHVGQYPRDTSGSAGNQVETYKPQLGPKKEDDQYGSADIKR